jgi:hypothetical protein
MPADELSRLGAALANSVGRRLDGILAAEFPTDSPIVLGQILRDIVCALERLTLNTGNTRIAGFACESIRDDGQRSSVFRERHFCPGTGISDSDEPAHHFSVESDDIEDRIIVNPLGADQDARVGYYASYKSFDRYAIAAGWFYYVGKLSLPYSVDRNWEAADDETLNRLVLKAVESIVIKQQFANWMKGKAE